MRFPVSGRAILCVVLAALSAPSMIQAQETGGSKTDGPRTPRLGGHTFSPNRAVADPFITTDVKMLLGMGKANNFEIPLAVIDGDTLTALRGDLLFAVLDLGYQHAINDWLAIRGRFGVTGRLGTGTGGLLASGVTAVTSFELGWLFRLFQYEKTMLSLDVGVANNSFTGVNILRFVEDVIAGDPQAALVRTTPSVRGFSGARFAWAISDIFGLLANGTLGYGESVSDKDTSEWFYGAGILIDADLGARTSVPISFALGYTIDTFPEGGDATAGPLHGAVFRIGYTGREDLALGLTFTFDSVPSSVGQRLSFSSTGLGLRYYF